MKNILVLSGSPRKGGNSDLMAKAFKEGAESAGHKVAIFEAGQKKIEPCKACDTCFSTGLACTFEDDFRELAPLVQEADVLVIVTPLYFYSFSAQIKSALDKFYAFDSKGKPLAIRESYLLACCAEDKIEAFDGLVKSYELTAKYCQWEDKGQILVTDVQDKFDILKTNWLDKIKKIAQSA